MRISVQWGSRGNGQQKICRSASLLTFFQFHHPSLYLTPPMENLKHTFYVSWLFDLIWSFKNYFPPFWTSSNILSASSYKFLAKETLNEVHQIVCLSYQLVVICNYHPLYFKLHSLWHTNTIFQISLIISHKLITNKKTKDMSSIACHQT